MITIRDFLLGETVVQVGFVRIRLQEIQDRVSESVDLNQKTFRVGQGYFPQNDATSNTLESKYQHSIMKYLSSELAPSLS